MYIIISRMCIAYAADDDEVEKGVGGGELFFIIGD